MLIDLLEDDPIQRELYGTFLETAGHTCRRFDTARAFCEGLRDRAPELLLIDWMLPDGQGDQVIRFVREDLASTVPIVVLTMRDDEANIVMALRGGADDYIVKPPRPMELVARIDALARRARAAAPQRLQLGSCSLNLRERSASVGGVAVELTGKEFDLAVHLFQHVGRLLSRQNLLEAVWGIQADIDTRTVDAHVSRLRRKLRLAADQGLRLNAVYGFGYRLERLD